MTPAARHPFAAHRAPGAEFGAFATAGRKRDARVHPHGTDANPTVPAARGRPVAPVGATAPVLPSPTREAR